MLCKNCGKEIPINSEFCVYCGTRIGKTSLEHSMDNSLENCLVNVGKTIDIKDAKKIEPKISPKISKNKASKKSGVLIGVILSLLLLSAALVGTKIVIARKTNEKALASLVVSNLKLGKDISAKDISQLINNTLSSQKAKKIEDDKKQAELTSKIKNIDITVANNYKELYAALDIQALKEINGIRSEGENALTSLTNNLNSLKSMVVTKRKLLEAAAEQNYNFEVTQIAQSYTVSSSDTRNNYADKGLIFSGAVQQAQNGNNEAYASALANARNNYNRELSNINLQLLISEASTNSEIFSLESEIETLKVAVASDYAKNTALLKSKQEARKIEIKKVLLATLTLKAETISWINYSSPDGIFTISLPENPKITEETVSFPETSENSSVLISDGNNEISIKKYSCSTSRGFPCYLILQITYPAGQIKMSQAKAQELLAALVNGMVGVSDELVVNNFSVASEYNVLDFSIENTGTSNKYYRAGRVLMKASNKIYVLLSISPEAPTQATSNFIESFIIISALAN